MIILKIGVISDTHINAGNLHRLNNFLQQHMEDIDMIIHAGDYISSKAIHSLKEFKNFVGVWGNVDGEDTRQLVPEKKIIEIENYSIGIFHGHGLKKTTMDRAYEAFKDEDVDIIIFGHSHQPIIKTKNKVLLLNPGSPTDKRNERWFSFIILELDNDSVSAQLKFFT